MLITIKDVYFEPFDDSCIHPVPHQKCSIIPVQRFRDMNPDQLFR